MLVVLASYQEEKHLPIVIFEIFFFWVLVPFDEWSSWVSLRAKAKTADGKWVQKVHGLSSRQ